MHNVNLEILHFIANKLLISALYHLARTIVENQTDAYDFPQIISFQN